jgi:hypothetical protein
MGQQKVSERDVTRRLSAAFNGVQPQLSGTERSLWTLRISTDNEEVPVSSPGAQLHPPGCPLDPAWSGYAQFDEMPQRPHAWRGWRRLHLCDRCWCAVVTHTHRVKGATIRRGFGRQQGAPLTRRDRATPGRRDADEAPTCRLK